MRLFQQQPLFEGLPGIPRGIPGNRFFVELLPCDVAQIRTELYNFVIRTFDRAVETFDH